MAQRPANGLVKIRAARRPVGLSISKQEADRPTASPYIRKSVLTQAATWLTIAQ